MTDLDARPLGLLTAIPAELADFERDLAVDRQSTVGGTFLRLGRLEGVSVVLAECGIGKVNAAMAATVMLDRFGCRGLIFSGVAGGLDPALSVGDIVVATSLVQHDYGALAGGVIETYQPGRPPLPGVPTDHGYPADPAMLAKVRAALAGVDLPALSSAAVGGSARRPRIAYGPILTGDAFLNCASTRARLHASFRAMAIEMEGAAVAQVAEKFGVPVTVVRALSDLAGEDSHMDFTAFLEEAGLIAAGIVRRLLPVL